MDFHIKMRCKSSLTITEWRANEIVNGVVRVNIIGWHWWTGLVKILETRKSSISDDNCQEIKIPSKILSWKKYYEFYLCERRETLRIVIFSQNVRRKSEKLSKSISFTGFSLSVGELIMIIGLEASWSVPISKWMQFLFSYLFLKIKMQL